MVHHSDYWVLVAIAAISLYAKLSQPPATTFTSSKHMGVLSVVYSVEERKCELRFTFYQRLYYIAASSFKQGAADVMISFLGEWNLKAKSCESQM